MARSQVDELVTRRHALDVIRSWPDESRRAANWILHLHGEPDVAESSELVWSSIGPWKRVVATRTFLTREAPFCHTASVRSVIDYDVPADKIDLISELDGDLEFHPETGEVSAVGQNLSATVLALNLMVDVMADAITPHEARRRYVKTLLDAQCGQLPDEMVGVHFADGGAGGLRLSRPIS